TRRRGRRARYARPRRPRSGTRAYWSCPSRRRERRTARSPPGRVERDEDQDHADARDVEGRRRREADALHRDGVRIAAAPEKQSGPSRERETDQEDEAHAVHEGEVGHPDLERVGQYHRRDGGGDGAGFARLFPEQAEQEDHGDTRGEEAREFLDELEGLI